MLTYNTIQLVYSYLSLDEVYRINKIKITNDKIFYVNIPLYCKYTKINITMDRASENGYLEVIKYLHSIGKECTDNAMDFASENGYLEVIKYLHSIGKVCTTYAMDWASRNDHLEVVKYLHRIRKK